MPFYLLLTLSFGNFYSRGEVLRLIKVVANYFYFRHISVISGVARNTFTRKHKSKTNRGYGCPFLKQTYLLRSDAFSGINKTLKRLPLQPWR